MSEQMPHFYDRDPLSGNPALSLLARDLRLLTSPSSLDMSFMQYLDNELGTSDAEGALLYSQMIQRGVITPIGDGDVSCEELRNEYRIALFTDIRPIYFVKNSINAYNRWLPSALHVMLAGNEQHEADICYRTNGRDVTECERGRCPLRVVQDEVTRQLTQPDFTSIEYAIDPNKMHQQVAVLLMHATNYSVVSESDAWSLEHQYENHCRSHFGPER